MSERWDWEHATQAQRRAVAQLPAEERLRWLEEAQELALRAGVLSTGRRTDRSRRGTDHDD